MALQQQPQYQNINAYAMASGFSHSLAIGGKHQLYVWGNNQNHQLSTSSAAVIERPEEIYLQYNGSKYAARSVACCQNINFVIGSRDAKWHIELDNEEIEILRPLKKILANEGTLAYFFGIVPGQQHNEYSLDNNETEPQHEDPANTKNIGGVDYGRVNLHSGMDDKLPTEEAQFLTIPRNTFVERIEKHCIASKRNKIDLLAEKLLTDKAGGRSEENILLHSIEDYVLGFKQDSVKLFCFGQGHKRQFAFLKQLNNSEDEISDGEDSNTDRDQKLHKKYQDEILVITRPTVIKFPKFTFPITQVACGLAHVLAITENYELYSWGCGSYGALGFGTRQDVKRPTKITMSIKSQMCLFTRISCGKEHSLAITRKNKLFSWGKGQGGRLGHGDEEDQLIPKEVAEINKKKAVYCAAGDSHSACISQKLKLYTWGNNTYGRLGHGLEIIEKKPKLVEDLDQEDIIWVSCGSFHTMCITTGGSLFGFGEGKYGKLGLNKADREAPVKLPEKISFSQTLDILGDPNIETEVVQVVASYNHSMCLTRKGTIFTWGYTGKGLLARETKDKIKQPNYIPLPVAEDMKIIFMVQDKENLLAKGETGKQLDNVSNAIVQVACGQINTVTLTNGGEIYIFGSNTYGQLGRMQGDKQKNNNEEEKQKESQVHLIKFDNKIRISQIACGGEHIFAITRQLELYGWGRNDEGQLGLGYLSECIDEPTLIKDISHKQIKFIACGDNYSAAATIFGDVYVTGSLEGGKLGLGDAWKKGFLLSFMQVTTLKNIIYLSCGPNHMLAIKEYVPENNEKDGSCYSWGRNTRGQLGHGNKDDLNLPKKIANAKDRFIKVEAGSNFSLAMSQKALFFWGNYKYSIDQTKDVEEPQIIKMFENQSFKDISVCYKFVSVINDKGEIWKWGDYLKERYNKHKKKENQEQKKQGAARKEAKRPSKFPQSSKFDVLMEKISTGPSHTAAIAIKKKLYTWGYKGGSKLGLQEHEFKKAKIQPMLVNELDELLLKNMQSHEEEEGRGDDKMKNDKAKKSIIPGKEEQKQAAGQGDDKKQDKPLEGKPGPDGKQLPPAKEEQKMPIANNNDENGDDINEDEKGLPQEKLNIVSLDRSESKIEATIQLQRILKLEKNERLDELSIIRFDDEVQKDIIKLLKTFQKFTELEKQRKELLIANQSSFLQRITEKPFLLEIMPDTRKKHIEQKLWDKKRILKNVLTIVQVHPCYLINLYKLDVMPKDEFFKIFKEIYSYPNKRIIYLMISFFLGIIDTELKQYASLEEVDFSSKDSLIGKVFMKIFKSHPTNTDTLSSFACHILNQILAKQAINTTKQDGQFDVQNNLDKGLGKQFDENKQQKIQQQEEKCLKLYEFLELQIRNLVNDQVLLNPSFFVLQPRLAKILANRQKKIESQAFKSDEEAKIPSLRFSSEIGFLASVLKDKLKELKCTGSADEIINNKILSLIFGKLKTVWTDYQIYLYPYVKSAKGLSIIEDIIKKTHMQNLDNVFELLDCFFKGDHPFEGNNKEGWNKKLVQWVSQLSQQHKSTLLEKIIDKYKTKSISFHNFQELVLHSIESEGQTITIRKRNLTKLCTLLVENRDNICIIKPADQDPLFGLLNKLGTSIKELSKCKRSDKINFKLKSRLLMSADSQYASRCNDCNVILSKEYAPVQSMSILEKYNPEDSQSLIIQFCKILRSIDDISKNDTSLVDIIEKILNKNTQQNQQVNYDLVKDVLKFQNYIDIEIDNVNNKQEQMLMVNAFDEDPEKKVKEQIYDDLQKQALAKINQRRTKRFQLNIIKKKIAEELMQKIDQKIVETEQREFILYKTVQTNYQYGLANHELKDLADAYTKLHHMRDIISYTTSTQLSKNLFKNLRNEQKMNLRSIVKKKAADLINDGTIKKPLKMRSLEIIIDKCELVFFEGEDQAINVKLVFREVQRSCWGPSKVTAETVMLTDTITAKDLLLMRKTGKAGENKTKTLANSLEFDQPKLLRILNDMERSKSAYVLNSGATPDAIQKQQAENKV